VKPAVSGVCACGAIITATPAIAITSAQAPISVHYPSYQGWSQGDSDPFEAAEPDPTFDGPAAAYAGTIPTSHIAVGSYRWQPSRRFYDGPRDPKYLRAPSPANGDARDEHGAHQSRYADPWQGAHFEPRG
jgi:hypothetical protein